MRRTFVWVELDADEAEPTFADAMKKLGFVESITGSPSRKILKLPAGMFLIERTSPVEALELARKAARKAKTRARIFCMPSSRGLRFDGLRPA